MSFPNCFTKNRLSLHPYCSSSPQSSQEQTLVLLRIISLQHNKWEPDMFKIGCGLTVTCEFEICEPSVWSDLLSPSSHPPVGIVNETDAIRYGCICEYDVITIRNMCNNNM